MSGLVQRKKYKEEEETTSPNEEDFIPEKYDNQGQDLTLMEELILLALKDSDGLRSFWNDNISYVINSNYA